MITVTPAAARQIRVAASRSEADDLGLRIAARRDERGSLHYAMGFDEMRDGDVVVPSEGVALVVSAAQRDLLDGLTLDYVELEAGDFRFIFVHPDDAARADDPARSDAPAAGGCGSGACGCDGG